MQTRQVLGTRGKLGVEKQMSGVMQVAESLWAGFALRTRSCPCEILQEYSLAPQKIGRKSLLVSILALFSPHPAPFYFLLTCVAFFLRKDSLQGHIYFFHGEK